MHHINNINFHLVKRGSSHKLKYHKYYQILKRKYNNSYKLIVRIVYCSKHKVVVIREAIIIQH
jgi:hypothetical protein